MLGAFWQRRFHSPIKSSPRRIETVRLSLEALEDRLVLSTFLVTNASDNLQPGSLRYAITQANFSGNGPSTVEITPQVSGPIVLTLSELLVNSSMTLENDSGAPLTIRQQTATSRVLGIGANAGSVAIVGGPSSGITLAGGVAGYGGGIFVSGASTTLTLSYVDVFSNAAGIDGGGIYSAGSVVLNHSSIAGNWAGGDGGGIFVNDGNVTLNEGSAVNNNQSPNGKGGGINVQLGTVALSSGSQVNGNKARNVGGIEVGNVPQPWDNAVSVSGSSTVNYNSSTATVNPFTGDFGGGGIAVEGFGNVYISDGQVSDNYTVGMYSGGIVVALGSVTVTDGSQIDGNSNNGPGGGIAANFLGTITVSNGSQVDGNIGGAIGGGIVNFAGPLGRVIITGGSEVDGNVLTNGESLGQALAVFIIYAFTSMTSGQAAQSLNGPDGGAFLAALPEIALEISAYSQLEANPSILPGILTAGGGIGTLLAPISINEGSEVDNNFAGKRVSNGAAFSIGLGGGIYGAFGPIFLSVSSVDGNKAPYGNGGGVWSGGALFANSSTLADDSSALFGGGEFNLGLVLLLNSTITKNDALIGGGIANQGAVTMLGSKVVYNTAQLIGGGFANLQNGQLTPIDSTIFFNDPNNVL